MDTHRTDSGGSFFGTGVVRTKRQSLVRPDYSPQGTYRSIVIRANKNNTGILYIDTGDETKRLSLRPGEEARLEIATVHNVYILGSSDDTAYSWTAK
jgi:hypothetical protein